MLDFLKKLLKKKVIPLEGCTYVNAATLYCEIDGKGYEIRIIRNENYGPLLLHKKLK